MSKIDELVTSVENMTDEQLLELVRGVRSQRRIRKPKKAPTAASKEKKKDTLRALLGGLSPEERKEMLAKFAK